jgi:hypothetical protein
MEQRPDECATCHKVPGLTDASQRPLLRKIREELRSKRPSSLDFTPQTRRKFDEEKKAEVSRTSRTMTKLAQQDDTREKYRSRAKGFLEEGVKAGISVDVVDIVDASKTSLTAKSAFHGVLVAVGAEMPSIGNIASAFGYNWALFRQEVGGFYMGFVPEQLFRASLVRVTVKAVVRQNMGWYFLRHRSLKEDLADYVRVRRELDADWPQLARRVAVIAAWEHAPGNPDDAMVERVLARLGDAPADKYLAKAARDALASEMLEE